MPSDNRIAITRVTLNHDLAKIIHEIQSATWLPASEISPDDYSIDDLKACIQIPENLFCIANLEDTFAGMASATIRNKPDGDIWLYVDEVDVCENMLRSGVGTALMQYLIDHATKHDYDEVWLGTEPDNIPANALYKSLNPDDVSQFVGYTYTIKEAK